MKKGLTRIILTIIQIIIDFNILFLGMSIFVGLIFLLAAPFTGVGHEFFDYHGWWGLTVQVLDAAALALLTMITMLGTRNLLSNLNDGDYFVGRNMLAVRQILWSSVAILLLGGINTLVFNAFQIRDHLHIFIMRGDDFADYLGFLTFVFLIYLIFKRGLALQKDADEII